MSYQFGDGQKEDEGVKKNLHSGRMNSNRM